MRYPERSLELIKSMVFLDRATSIKMELENVKGAVNNKKPRVIRL